MKNFKYAVLFLSSIFFVSGVFAEDTLEKKAVLVTGASSGIGLRIAETLAKNGYHVYAGARKEADLKRLDAINNISSVKLDVTSQEDIESAVSFVKDQGRGLWGIVNNAGVQRLTKLSSGSVDRIRFTFEVNVFGPIRVNRSFLPFLLEGGGRTVTIGSVNGFMASGQDGGYSASKFAVEGYTDSLAAELAGSEVHVSIVEPGQYKSKIRVKRLGQLLAAADAGDIKLEPAQRAELLRTEWGNNDLTEPDDVAAAVLNVVSSDTPKRRYLVTPNQAETYWAIGSSLQRLVQLNEDHAYSYTRDQLVEFLDQMMSES